MYQRYNVATFSTKNGKVQYRKSQRGREDEKSKRGGEDGKGERNEKGHWGNKVNSVVRENSSFEASVYHYIIYKCQQRLVVLR